MLSIVRNNDDGIMVIGDFNLNVDNTQTLKQGSQTQFTWGPLEVESG